MPPAAALHLITPPLHAEAEATSDEALRAKATNLEAQLKRGAALPGLSERDAVTVPSSHTLATQPYHAPLPRPYHALTTPLHARPGSDTAMPARRPPHPPPHASPRHTQAELDGVTARNAVLRSTRDGGRTQLQSADAQLTSLEADLAAAQAATPYVRGCNTVHEWLRPYA